MPFTVYLSDSDFDRLVKRLTYYADRSDMGDGYSSLLNEIHRTKQLCADGWLLNKEHIRLAADSIDGNVHRRGRFYDALEDKWVVRTLRSALRDAKVKIQRNLRREQLLEQQELRDATSVDETLPVVVD